MNAIAQDVLSAVDELQNQYIAALDDKDMDGWAATFAQSDDATYICRSAENEANGWPIALMLDDCRARILDRITFVTKVWRGTFEDYRTRHYTQRLSCKQESDSTYRVRSNFSIEYTHDPAETKILATGVYEDVVVIEDGQALFQSKRAIYDTTVLPQYIVYPF